jgi:hypothetical protein
MGSTATICTADSKPLSLKVALWGHLQQQERGSKVAITGQKRC